MIASFLPLRQKTVSAVDTRAVAFPTLLLLLSRYRPTLTLTDDSADGLKILPAPVRSRPSAPAPL